MIQVFIETVLFFIVMLVIGLVLNTLMKTTWFPILLYIIVVVPLLVWSLWDHSKSFIANLLSFSLAELLPIVAALVGAYTSGLCIRWFRRKT